jgi:hypothetical protein
MSGVNQQKKQFVLDQLKMKVVCKVKGMSTLTYLKVYDVIRYNAGDSGYTIIDDFENQQSYYHGYFMSLEEGRDYKLDILIKDKM